MTPFMGHGVAAADLIGQHVVVGAPGAAGREGLEHLDVTARHADAPVAGNMGVALLAPPDVGGAEIPGFPEDSDLADPVGSFGHLVHAIREVLDDSLPLVLFR